MLAINKNNTSIILNKNSLHMKTSPKSLNINKAPIMHIMSNLLPIIHKLIGNSNLAIRAYAPISEEGGGGAQVFTSQRNPAGVAIRKKFYKKEFNIKHLGT